MSKRSLSRRFTRPRGAPASHSALIPFVYPFVSSPGLHVRGVPFPGPTPAFSAVLFRPLSPNLISRRKNQRAFFVRQASSAEGESFFAEKPSALKSCFCPVKHGNRTVVGQESGKKSEEKSRNPLDRCENSNMMMTLDGNVRYGPIV